MQGARFVVKFIRSIVLLNGKFNLSIAAKAQKRD